MDAIELSRKIQTLYIEGNIPVIQVDTSIAPCFVPHDLVENNMININVHPRVIKDYKITDSTLRFKTCFDSKCYVLTIPVEAVVKVINGGKIDEQE